MRTSIPAQTPSDRQPSAGQAQQPATLLYIAGAVRSGSTALSLLLDQHPEIVAISQPEWLSDYAAPGESCPCTCGKPISECSFWRAVAAGFAEATQRAYDPSFADAYLSTSSSWLLRPDLRAAHVALSMLGVPSWLTATAKHIETVAWNLQAAAENHLLFAAVRAASGKPVVVDASKLPARGKLLYLTAPESTRLLWLVRDGRAAAWSRARRSGVSFEHATLAWVRAHLEIAGMLATVPARRRLLVRYEDICREPAQQLSRITRLLGVRAHTPERVLHKARAHLVGGNEMRYLREHDELELDERWRRHVSAGDLRRFRLVGGWLNRLFGYD